MAEEVITFEGEILRWEVEEKDRLKRDRRQNRRDATRHDRNKYVLGNQLLYVGLSILTQITTYVLGD